MEFKCYESTITVWLNIDVGLCGDISQQSCFTVPAVIQEDQSQPFDHLTLFVYKNITNTPNNEFKHKAKQQKIELFNDPATSHRQSLKSCAPAELPT